MTAAGRLTNHWSLVDRKVKDLGGQPEDLYLLGSAEDDDVRALVDATAKKLVARGKALRAASVQRPSSVPPQLSFRVALTPKHLFLLNKNGADAPTLQSAMGGAYFVSDYAKGMMSTPECVIGPAEAALVGVYTCEQLGVTGWPETDLFGTKGWEHVKQFGLTKCLIDDGPYVRIAYAKQELGEWFRFGHNPIPFGGYSRVWFVGHGYGSGRFLSGWNLNPSNRLDADDLVALRLAQ